MREGRFCATLFLAARKLLILNGEMSEWSIEHAWKAIRVSRIEQHQDTAIPNRFNDFALPDAL